MHARSISVVAFVLFAVSLLAFASSEAVAGPYEDAVLSNNPVVYWRFEDAGGAGSTVADTSGNARTGTVGATGPNFGLTSAAPNLGNAVQWTGPDAGNGSTKRVTFDAAVPELINVRPPAVNKSTTVEYWVNFSQQGSGDNTWTNPSILGDESPGDGDMYWGNIANGGQFRMSTSDLREIRVDNIDDDMWHHIMMVKTWDTVGPSKSTLYLDGGALAGGTTIGPVDTAGGNPSYQDADGAIFALGLTTAGGGGNVQFQGLLDELAIYNTALTATDAAAHFEAAFAEGSAVPEPSTFVMTCLGLLGLGALTWRKRRRIA